MKKEKKGLFIFKVILCVFLALVCGFGVTVLSAFMPVYLQSASEFYVIDYGSPIPFIQQTTNMVPNPAYFPLYFTPKYQHESFETELMIEPLVVSVIINVLIFAVIFFVIWGLHRSYRKKHPKKQKVNKKDIYRPVFAEQEQPVTEDNK